MQMETTNQLKKDFKLTLSRLSHEIRNPITLINIHTYGKRVDRMFPFDIS